MEDLYELSPGNLQICESLVEIGLENNQPDCIEEFLLGKAEKHVEDSERLGCIYLTLGNLNSYLNQNDRALTYLELAAVILSKCGDESTERKSPAKTESRAGGRQKGTALKDELKVSHFKCFGSDPQGFDRIAPFNIIIGRNNSGKSSLLDLLTYVTKNKFNIPRTLWNGDESPVILGRANLPEYVVKSVFRKNHSGGGVPGNHWEYGKQLVGTSLRWRLNGENRFVSIDNCSTGDRPLDNLKDRHTYETEMANQMPNPLSGRIFSRIVAERNIVSESATANLTVNGDGSGVTNLIQSFINKSNLPSSIVEQSLLEDLNRIFQPDTVFSRIGCQQLENDNWEIFLDEEQKGRIPLSQSGSGIKTVIIF
ncbi:MAG: ATP-binding protein [Acidobacteria bacterium]|nr:ATP-binding protein [Acidobacteriota bacterium]